MCLHTPVHTSSGLHGWVGAGAPRRESVSQCDDTFTDRMCSPGPGGCRCKKLETFTILNPKQNVVLLLPNPHPMTVSQ